MNEKKLQPVTPGERSSNKPEECARISSVWYSNILSVSTKVKHYQYKKLTQGSKGVDFANDPAHQK